MFYVNVSDFRWLHIPNGHKMVQQLQPFCFSLLNKHSKQIVRKIFSHLSFNQKKNHSSSISVSLYENLGEKDAKEWSPGKEGRKKKRFCWLETDGVSHTHHHYNKEGYLFESLYK